MNTVAVKDALRKTVVDSTGIDPVSQIQYPNMVFDPAGKDLWVAEFVPGGDFSSLSNARSSCNAFLVQYNFNVPTGKSIDNAERKAAAFTDAIPPGTMISCDGVDCMVRSHKTNISVGKNFSSVMVLVTLFVSAVDKNFIVEKQ